MIDWLFIEQQYQAALKELVAVKPLSHWSIKPRGLLKTNHKTKYGMADLNGNIHINQAFVGTSANQLLDATIRHELAHLFVGLHHGHNAVFKAAEFEFGTDFKSIDKKQFQQLSDNIGYKYQLYASFKGGDVILLKKVQRKHRKYTHYKPTVYKYLTIKGRKVVSFYYCELS